MLVLKCNPEMATLTYYTKCVATIYVYVPCTDSLGGGMESLSTFLLCNLRVGALCR